MNMKNIFLLCSVAALSEVEANKDLLSLKGSDMQGDHMQVDEDPQNISKVDNNKSNKFDMQIINDLKKYIKRNGNDSHTPKIDDFQQTLKNCKFFMFRHHRSAADQFERIIKSDENAYLLEIISTIENDKEIIHSGKNLKQNMSKVLDNYQDKIDHCEPILLSNVISVKKYYNHFYQYYKNITDENRKRRVDETIFLRMRNFERAMNKGKRLEKGRKKNYDDKFVWETSLSEEYRNSDEPKIVNYIKKTFGNVAAIPKLLPPFNTILETYSASLKHASYNKAQQLVDYFFNGKDLGVLDWAEWPADPKQADQMKRWLLRGNEVPILYKDNTKVQELCENIATIVKQDGIDDIASSWFTTEVLGIQGIEAESSTNSNQVREEEKESFEDLIKNLFGDNNQKDQLLKDEHEFEGSAKTYMISMFFGLII